MRRIPEFTRRMRPRFIGGAAPWTPLELSPLVWLKQGALVYSDAGTTPAVDTDPVYQWGDSSGNGFNANQTTLGNRPLYAANSGNPYLDFETNKYLNLGTAGLSTPDGITVYVRFTPDSVAGNNFLVCKDDETDGRSYSFGMLAAKFFLEVNGTTQVFSSSAGFSAGNEYRMCVLGNNSIGWKAFVNGVQHGTTQSWLAPNSNSAETNVGRRSYSGFENYANGKMRDVLIFNTALSDDDFALLDAYFAA